MRIEELVRDGRRLLTEAAAESNDGERGRGERVALNRAAEHLKRAMNDLRRAEEFERARTEQGSSVPIPEEWGMFSEYGDARLTEWARETERRVREEEVVLAQAVWDFLLMYHRSAAGATDFGRAEREVADTAVRKSVWSWTRRLVETVGGWNEAELNRFWSRAYHIARREAAKEVVG